MKGDTTMRIITNIIDVNIGNTPALNVSSCLWYNDIFLFLGQYHTISSYRYNVDQPTMEKPLNPHFFSGFVQSKGCFHIGLQKDKLVVLLLLDCS